MLQMEFDQQLDEGQTIVYHEAMSESLQQHEVRKMRLPLTIDLSDEDGLIEFQIMAIFDQVSYEEKKTQLKANTLLSDEEDAIQLTEIFCIYYEDRAMSLMDEHMRLYEEE